MTLSRGNSLYRWHIDSVLAAVFATLASLVGTMLLLVLAFLVWESWPVLHNGGWQHFFKDDGWYPLEKMFGMMPMVWASLAVAVGAIVLAAPLGIASAMFQHFYAPQWLARLHQLMIALLAGIPSVVYGLWGLTVLVPLVGQWQPSGANLFTAILILSLMILPTVALTSASALKSVPRVWLHGAAALGMTRKGIVLGVAFPAARQEIISGVLLAIARALGETMAVLMVAGNVVQNPTGLFEPVRVLTANIALEMAYATGTHRAGLFASGLFLTLLVLLLAYLAAFFSRRPHHV